MLQIQLLVVRVTGMLLQRRVKRYSVLSQCWLTVVCVVAPHNLSESWQDYQTSTERLLWKDTWADTIVGLSVVVGYWSLLYQLKVAWLLSQYTCSYHLEVLGPPQRSSWCNVPDRKLVLKWVALKRQAFYAVSDKNRPIHICKIKLWVLKHWIDMHVGLW